MNTETTNTTAAQGAFAAPATAEDTEPKQEAEHEAATETELTAESPVSLDTIFEILKNQRRRQVLWYLSQSDEPVTLRNLSAYVAAAENDKPIGQLTSQERKRVYVGLYQCHLPKMDDMGFIEFNKNRGLVELGPAAHHADTYLRTDALPRHQWPRYYLGLVGVGWLLLLGSLATSLLTPVVAASGFLTLLTVYALIHTYSTLAETGDPNFAIPTIPDTPATPADDA